MTIPITGQPPVPSLAEPAEFNTKALNLFTWITGSMLDQFNDVDPADFFGIATQIEAEAGTDNTKVLTALRGKQAIDEFAATKAQGTKADNALPAASLATQIEAEAGTENTKYTTSLRVAQAIASLGVVKPTGAAGVGQWQSLSGATSISLPAGGTWAYFFIQTSDSGGGALGQAASVAAGGAFLAGPASGTTFRGFAWRIA